LRQIKDEPPEAKLQNHMASRNHSGCPRCGTSMALIRIAPKIGLMPQWLTFRCGHCGLVETVDDQPLRDDVHTQERHGWMACDDAFGEALI
jgi:hypothetical protein